MPDHNGRAVLQQLKRVWLAQRLLIAVLLSAATAVFATTLLHVLLAASFYQAIPLSVLVFVSYAVASRWWKVSEQDVVRYLNRREPALQESAELVLLPAEKLNGLQRLQQQKVAAAIAELQPSYPFREKVIKAMAVLLVALLISAILLYLPGYKPGQPRMKNTVATLGKNKAVLPPEIKSVSITVQPPAYTGKAAREQTQPDVQMEEGGTIFWQVETTGNSPKPELVFNDGSTVRMIASVKRPGVFVAQKRVAKSGFYQIKMGNILSDLYKMEVIADKPPAIVIQTPKPAITVRFGESQNILLQALLSDDYGVRSATISATISSGEGEAVKFKQQTLAFGNFIAGQRQQTVQKNLDLKALGMEPGNELYFFITAIDSHQQETRSDVQVITLEDTTVESSMDGMVNGLDIKPDLFRSERQIIIETEQLLQDRGKVSIDAFQKKSDDLGVDQKLLRLRYGKFLGEETDTEIGGHDHEGDEQHEKGYTNDATAIAQQYGHSHDNAEDATFFDAATKKQLKETLAEMWKAELQLRTFQPKEALVFEYKALRLLKDLQQKSRAYVAKTGFTPTPLKMEKRLTGELDKIGQPTVVQQFDSPALPEQVAREAIGELEQLKANGTLQPSQQTLLQQAFQQLSSKAAQAPSLYLSALSALRKVLSDNFRLRDITTAENGLQQMLAPPVKLPFATTTIQSKNLSDRYFINLSGGSRRP